MLNDRSIGISTLASRLHRGKDAAKALRDEIRHEIEPIRDLISTRPGEIEMGLDRLSPHPFNTRIVDIDDRDIVQLALSIERSGQTDPLTAVPLSEDRAGALVIDGTRRLMALKRLSRRTAKIILVHMVPADIAVFIQSRDRMQKRWSAYEFALHIDAIVTAYSSEGACADALGMKKEAFSKARAPTQLAASILAKIADPRKITGRDAATLRARYNRDPAAVEKAILTLSDDLPARAVFAALSEPANSAPPSSITLPFCELQGILTQLAADGIILPHPLATLFKRVMPPC